MSSINVTLHTILNNNYIEIQLVVDCDHGATFSIGVYGGSPKAYFDGHCNKWYYS